MSVGICQSDGNKKADCFDYVEDTPEGEGCQPRSAATWQNMSVSHRGPPGVFGEGMGTVTWENTNIL